MTAETHRTDQVAVIVKALFMLCGATPEEHAAAMRLLNSQTVPATAEETIEQVRAAIQKVRAS